ncbi:MAG: hypothetical protein HDT39_03905 [Lachnospiraceae bacterium]|nr:hypothetical protein [Lachnospiraceae bacterium]
MIKMRKLQFDSVYFGSYPQTEVKSIDSEYTVLLSVEGWDGNGDVVINGIKYRRILKGNATYATSGESGYYDWEDDTTYHYFRYEPVKWRVLKTDNNSAMLLSDIVLDGIEYNTEYKDTTWETSTIRSWLNGYNSDVNQEGISYSRSNFIDSAFTLEEKLAIEDTNIVNSNNLYWDTEGGNNTTDKLFLLSELEVYTNNAVTYGFVSDEAICDEARMCKSSDYAKAIGVYSDTSTKYESNCWWWLRSPGSSGSEAAGVCYDGFVVSDGLDVNYYNIGVRVTLNIDLSFSNIYTYAGTV